MPVAKKEFKVFPLNTSPDHKAYDLEKLLNDGWAINRADVTSQPPMPHPQMQFHPSVSSSVVVYILERDTGAFGPG